MVQKNSIIFLALLWIMPQFTTKRSIIPQFRRTDKVNYRQEDEIINNPQSCTSLECSMYRTPRDGEIDIMRWKEIQVYSIDMSKRKMLQDSSQIRLHNLNMEVYQHQGMLLQNLHCRYLYIVIQLPQLKDLDQKIPSL